MEQELISVPSLVGGGHTLPFCDKQCASLSVNVDELYCSDLRTSEDPLWEYWWFGLGLESRRLSDHSS